MKIRLDYKKAKDLADKIVNDLRPVCERIEIAGSVRRRKPKVGDIELVCIPRRQENLFGEPGVSLLDAHLVDLIAEGRIIRGDKWGPLQKKFHPVSLPDLAVELYITTPEQWGVIFTLRTGGKEFSQKLVTKRAERGLLPSHLVVKGGRIWDGDTALETPEEAEVFKMLGIDYIEPEFRW